MSRLISADKDVGNCYEFTVKEQHTTMGSSKVRNGFCGFLLGALPAFLLGLFYNERLLTTCSVAVSLGLLLGISSFLFGKRVLDFLLAALKNGFS